MATIPALDALDRLAHAWGIERSYWDIGGRQHVASPEALVRILRILGEAIDCPDDAPEALRRFRTARWQTPLEPVMVAWDGRLGRTRLRVPAAVASDAYRCRLELETGGAHDCGGRLADLPLRRQARAEGEQFTVRDLPLPGELPLGYHRLKVELDGRPIESLVIAAPRAAYTGPLDGRRLWGVFAPLYALHRRNGLGTGDFADLEALVAWVGGQGGSMVATLPLLAPLWELVDDPSPYVPSSRLFWNEFYIDVQRLPELAGCPEARALIEAAQADGQQQPRPPRATIDYPSRIAAKRRIMEALAESLFSSDNGRRAELEQFCRLQPEAEQFARFRAVGERQGRVWMDWPERLREGWFLPDDYDQSAYRYYLYSQWQAQEQLRSLAEKSRSEEAVWYLDFPLGVHRAGYDVWRNQELFAQDASGGAPPDTFFTKGQNWSFPPLHPWRLRRQGYAYFIAALRNHLRYARLVRLDHVMGLHRLFWIPEGAEATDGVYVHYPREEMFAVLSLESHRHQARVIGENLGTVPPIVNEAMRRHRVGGMYVLQYEIQPDRPEVLRQPPAMDAASLNTHDMPPFAAFWTGLDIDDRQLLGLVDQAEAQHERDQRTGLRHALARFLAERGLLAAETYDTEAVLEACLAWLGASDAQIVLVTLEDLCRETQPQNVPGTWTERPNWRRPLRYALEEFFDLPAATRILQTVNRSRQQTRQ